MKPFGLMADLHLHRWSSFSHELPSGMNSRLSALLSEISRCAAHVKGAGGDTVVMAGDVFHVRGSVAPSVLNPTKDALRAIHDAHGTEFIILPGNHDLEGKESTRLGSAVTALESSFTHVHSTTMFHPGINAVLIPWHENIADLKKMLETAAPGREGATFDAIIHAPIDGVIAGLPLHGLDPVYLAGLGYRHVFSGHYHNHKAFDGGERSLGAVSIGALAHHTWSDVGTRAGFLLVNPEVAPGTPAYTWFKSHLPEFVDLTKLAECDPDDIPLLVDQNYVRVRVEASKTKEVEEARAELLAMGARAVLVQAEPKPAASEVRVGATVKTGASLEASVGDFIKGMKEVADAAAVTSEALKVLGSVATMH